MELPWEAGFLEEAEQVNLKWNCEECSYFVPEESRCVHRYPTTKHRKGFYRSNPGQIVFCKDFELW